MNSNTSTRPAPGLIRGPSKGPRITRLAAPRGCLTVHTNASSLIPRQMNPNKIPWLEWNPPREHKFLLSYLLSLVCVVGSEALDLDPARSGGFAGWSEGYPQSVVVSGKYVIILLEGRLQIRDITLGFLKIGECAAGGGGARRVAASGEYACVESSYGFTEIVDISLPSAPRKVGTLDASAARSFAVSGHFLYLAAEALLIIDLVNPSAPRQACSNYLQGASAVAVNGNYAYITAGTTLSVFDVANPYKPIKCGEVEAGGGTRFICLTGNRAYLGRNDEVSSYSMSPTHEALRLLGVTARPTSLIRWLRGDGMYASDIRMTG